MRQRRRLCHRHDGRELHQEARLGLLGGGALALCLWAGAAAALDFPALYGVTGVGGDDVLNIRAEPEAGAAILGSYPPDRSRIEVLGLSPDGRWAEVGLPEGNGWVARRYLAPAPDLPFAMRCLGTEPFWSLTMAEPASRFLTPEQGIPLSLAGVVAARNGLSATLRDEEGRDWQVVAQAMHCTDGMSDRRYGWRMLMAGIGTAEAGGGPEIFAGCCTLDSGEGD